MIRIPLTQGKFAVFDEIDSDVLRPYRWYCMNNSGRGFYAVAVSGSGKARRRVFMHRVIMNPSGNLIVDHINGDGLDNRRSNLRLATYSQNSQNQRPKPRKYSQYKGVTWLLREKTWYAQIQCDKVNRNLGRFSNELDAARAYDAMARKLFGEFANLNFPE